MQKHCKPLKKLGRTSAHRRALLRNLATSLIIHERIITTAPKAKALKTWVDKVGDYYYSISIQFIIPGSPL